MIAPIDEPLVISSNVVLDKKVNFEGATDVSKILQVQEVVDQLSEKSSTSSKDKQEEEEVKATIVPSTLE